ncbi:MAG: hypothetical protein AB7L84_07685 [Acidimicrobiia bacterium]
MPTAPRFPLTTLSVVAWPDAVIDELGHDPRSAYVERFWLGLLGPSATWLMRRLAADLEARPEGFELDLSATAVALGLGRRGGKGGTFLRTIDRCCFFGAAQRLDDTSLRVRRKLPPLTRGQLARLPEELQQAHDVWADDPGAVAPSTAEDVRTRARRLALSLVELGEDAESTERQLHRWRIHPAMAREVTDWAIGRHLARAGVAAAL